MSKGTGSLIGIAVVVALVGVACSDASRPATAPPSSQLSKTAVTSSLLGATDDDLDPTLSSVETAADGAGKTLAALLVTPINRNVPLAADVTWSFVAGPNGAVSRNPNVGLTFVIPPNALSTTQTITITALAGAPVAYKFEPHGLVFNRNTYFAQNLTGTNASMFTALYGAYFATDRLELSPSGLANVTELIPTILGPFGRTVTFPVKHFSGYLVSSG